MTDTTARVRASVAALDGWVSRNGWAGYDPHDIRGNPVFMFLLQTIRSKPLKVLRRLALTPVVAFESTFPGFARRAFRVPKTINAKGMALFARAYLQLYEVSSDEAYRAKGVECLAWLAANRSPGYDEPGWGYPFNWQSGVVTPAGTPASVVTSAVADAFWTGYRVLGDRSYLAMCEGICRGFLSYLTRDEMADGTICFSYTPLDDFHVHNANLLVAEILTRVGAEVKNQDWVDIGIRAGRYALNEQNPDGSLYYWGRVQDYQCPKCVDHYHSGFEIRCLYGIARNTGRQDFLEAARRYYRFYRECLLSTEGGTVKPKMTPTSFYPVNIHSCAEAILVASTLAGHFEGAAEDLDPVTDWVIANMQTPAGSFAYMRRKRFGKVVVNAFPYMRWAQGWMLLALSHYLLTRHRQHTGTGARAA